jgi:tetratricopeptide (TPR) repeat protein
MTRNPDTDPGDIYAQAMLACTRREWHKALELASRLLRLAPGHGGVCYIIGVSSMELQQLPRALEYLRRATELDPGRANFSTQYAKALSLAGFQNEAVLAADKAAALSPNDPSLLFSLGMIYALARAHERAAIQFRHATALMPAHAASRYHLAISLIALGDTAEAERELEACLTLDPAYWKAHLSLSLSLSRRQMTDRKHLERMESLLSQVGGEASNRDAHVYLNMALAKKYEDLADYNKAFEHLAAGKRAGGTGRNYSSGHDALLFEAIIRASPEPQAATVGSQGNEPIFVIGMPRSGTTLVERIISSHPDVYSAGELHNFAVALKRASGSKTPDFFDADTVARSSTVDWRKLGADYLASTRPETAVKPRFIDKLPHNFLYVGAIANALPNARIICLRRDPMDTCLSNFRQLFAPDSPYHDYSYDLLDIGRYYILFDRLMAHWKQAFPGRILEIDYEKIVDAQEDCSRGLLDFCGLTWNDACMHFEENAAPVTSASALQVREPIYRNALRRWKKYEAKLDDLQKLLTEAGLLAGK